MELNVLYDKKPYVEWKTDLPSGIEVGKSKFFTLYDQSWLLVLERRWHEIDKEETWNIYLQQISQLYQRITFDVTTYFVNRYNEHSRMYKETCTFSSPTVARIFGFGKSLVSTWCPHPENQFKREVVFLFTFEAPMNNLQRESQVERQSLELLSLETQVLFNSKNYADVVLKCGNESFPAHRNILSARCEVLAAKLQRSGAGEMVHITGMQSAILDIFLQYLYCGKIGTGLTTETAMDLYRVAVDYNVHLLKCYCVSFLVETLTENCICSVFLLADQFREVHLMDAAVSFLVYRSAFFESVAWSIFTSEQPALSRAIYDKYMKYKNTFF